MVIAIGTSRWPGCPQRTFGRDCGAPPFTLTVRLPRAYGAARPRQSDEAGKQRGIGCSRTGVSDTEIPYAGRQSPDLAPVSARWHLCCLKYGQIVGAVIAVVYIATPDTVAVLVTIAGRCRPQSP